MDPAAFVFKFKQDLTAGSAAHADDTITVTDKKKSDEIQDYISKHFKYGESKNPSCRYLGSNISRIDDDITLNQDHYI